jgi:hypothetical protein
MIKTAGVMGAEKRLGEFVSTPAHGNVRISHFFTGFRSRTRRASEQTFGWAASKLHQFGFSFTQVVQWISPPS